MDNRWLGKPRAKMIAGILAAGLAVLLLMDFAIASRFRAQSRAGLDLACHQFKQGIEDFFSVRFGALFALKALVESSDSINPSQFQTFCSSLLKDIPYYRGIAFADNNFFIREVYPRQPNQSLLGLSLKEPADIYEPFRRAIRDQRLTISSVVNLRHAGASLLANVPVFRAGRLQGVVIGIFDFNEIMEKSISAEARARFYFRLLDSQGRMIHVGPGSFPSQTSQGEVRVGDSAWKLYFAYKGAAIPGQRFARQMLWLLGLAALAALIACLHIVRSKQDNMQKVHAQLKKANERIHALETKKQETILQRLGEGVVMVDADARVLSANRIAASLLERGIHKAIRAGEHISVTMEPFDISMPLEKILYAPGAVEFELSLKESDSVVYACVASAILDEQESRKGTVLTLRDISRARSLEKFKQQFIGRVSQSLEEPLALVQESLSLLREGIVGALNEKQAALLARGTDKARELARRVARLSDFVAIERNALKGDLRKETCYVEDFIAQAIAQMSSEIQEKNVTLERALMSGLTLHGGDRARLQQMMADVLENAVRTSPPGGNVRLATYLANGHVLIDVIKAAENAAEADDAPLFIARQIAKAHDGELLIKHEDGKASMLKILLPYR